MVWSKLRKDTPLYYFLVYYRLTHLPLLKNSCFTAVLQCFANSFTKANILMQIYGDVFDHPRRALSTGEVALWSFSLSYLGLAYYPEVSKTTIKPMVLQCFLEEHVCRNTKLTSTSLRLRLLGDAWKAGPIFYHIFQLRYISRHLLKKPCWFSVFLRHIQSLVFTRK